MLLHLPKVTDPPRYQCDFPLRKGIRCPLQGPPCPSWCKVNYWNKHRLSSAILQAINVSAASKYCWVASWDTDGCAVSNVPVFSTQATGDPGMWCWEGGCRHRGMGVGVGHDSPDRVLCPRMCFYLLLSYPNAYLTDSYQTKEPTRCWSLRMVLLLNGFGLSRHCIWQKLSESIYWWEQVYQLRNGSRPWIPKRRHRVLWNAYSFHPVIFFWNSVSTFLISFSIFESKY